MYRLSNWSTRNEFYENNCTLKDSSIDVLDFIKVYINTNVAFFKSQKYYHNNKIIEPEPFSWIIYKLQIFPLLLQNVAVKKCRTAILFIYAY